MGGLIRPMHLLVLLVIFLIIFGPGKLPELGSAIGKAIRGFKSPWKNQNTNRRTPQTLKRANKKKE
jgi:sec-independent protein translocase protein TatA